MSLKRRRAINIDKAIIEALKVEAKRLDLKSHTTLAVAIILGKAERLPPMGDSSNKTLGVSMRESIWLSVKKRARERGEVGGVTMERILVGLDPPLTAEEISKGEAMAAEREAERALETPTSKPERKPKESPKVNASAPPLVIDYEEEDEEERKSRQSKLPKGSPLDPPKKPKQSGSESLNLEEEYLGGIYSL